MTPPAADGIAAWMGADPNGKMPVPEGLLDLQPVLDLIRAALEEDLGAGDVTTACLKAADRDATGHLLAKEDGVLAGAPVVNEVFRALDPAVRVEWSARDGDPVTAGQRIAELAGPAGALLAGERTALNFVQRMSGIATLTSRYARLIEGTRARVLDTRKTTPGHRQLEKYAVAIGGGENHRVGLFDQALFKENHLALAALAGQSLDELVTRARERSNAPVEIEVRDLDEARAARDAGADILMLDNFSIEELREAVRELRPDGAEAPRLEASGGITLETLRAVAETGVDRISCGALTHSPQALDIAMYIDQP